MHPLIELRKILSNDEYRRKQGKVVRVTTSEIAVVVGNRVKTFERKKGDGTNYAQGDLVHVQGDMLIGKKRVKTNAKVYVV